MFGLGNGHSLSLAASRPLALPFVGPLDAYTSGLALALLPFRGFSAYEGAYCRVRDAGAGDAEQDAVYDALGEPVFPTLVGNGGLRWWYDQNGNTNDVPQSVAASQPFLIDNILNGYPVARFDGSNDELVLAAPLLAGANRTVYMVVKARSNGSNSRAWDDGPGSNASTFINDIANPYQYFSTTDTVSNVGGVPSAWNLIVLRYTDGTPTCECAPFVNNAATTPFFTNSHISGGMSLASSKGGDFAAVDIAARLDYSASHGDTTRQAIQSILATKFGITLS